MSRATTAAQARERAQRASAAAGAIASGLIAAGIFGVLDDARLGTKILAGFAFAAWASTGLILMLGGSLGVREGQNELQAVNRSIFSGFVCACVAIALTLATFGVNVAFPGAAKKVRLTVVLTPAGQRAVVYACSRLTGKKEIAGKTDDDQVGRSVIALDLDESTCGRSGRVTILLKSTDVGAVIESG
jgi:hypothetical protein